MARRSDPAALARQRRLNRLHSAALLLVLTLLAGITGLVVAGPDGFALAAGTVLLLLLLEPATPADLLLRHGFGAARLSSRQAPELLALVAELAGRVGLPRVPALYLIPSRMMQALAAGSRDAPAIAVTLGLVKALPPWELAAVLAHEVAHIRHGDVAVMRLAVAAASLTRAMAMLGLLLAALWWPIWWTLGEVPSPAAIILLLCAPLAGDLLALSLSRQREFLADARAAELTGDPVALASALARLQRLQDGDWERLASRGSGRWLRWFRTHPGIEERIRRLAAATVTVAPVRRPLADWDWATGRPAQLWRLTPAAKDRAEPCRAVPAPDHRQRLRPELRSSSCWAAAGWPRRLTCARLRDTLS